MSAKRKWDEQGPTDQGPATPSKVPKTEETKSANEAAAAAAAIAAKIAAQFASGALGNGSLIGGKDPHDGDFVQDIDINEVRNRYMLTKGTTQEDVRGLFDSYWSHVLICTTPDQQRHRRFS